MEELQWRPSRTASRRRHERRHSHDDDGLHNQINRRRTSVKGSTRHLGMAHGPLGPLEEGPALRSKHQNDEYIQSWLQQTQARSSPLPGLERHGGQPRAGSLAYRHGKRSRSPSEAGLPSPGTAKQAERQYEKRARRKTREDKYEYKARTGRTRVSD
jgi:hypothetical protein